MYCNLVVENKLISLVVKWYSMYIELAWTLYFDNFLIFSFPHEYYTYKHKYIAIKKSLSVNGFVTFNVFFRFKCIDLDGNGVLTRNEMQFFYEEQLHRMECMAQEPVLFEDILCQIIDMTGPEVHPFLFCNFSGGLSCPYCSWHDWTRGSCFFLFVKFSCFLIFFSLIIFPLVLLYNKECMQAWSRKLTSNGHQFLNASRL